jgi:putative DNA methylase
MSAVKSNCAIKELPELHPVPDSQSRRLIDLGLIHYDASSAGFNERYRRGETPQTVHVWWARRPHRAMRSLVYASLCRKDIEDAAEFLPSLNCDYVPPPLLLTAARKYVARDSPTVLDMFGGGGTIAFEASILGANTFTVDSNELSVFIQKALLVNSRQCKGRQLPSIVADSGLRVLEQLAKESDTLFPLRGQTFGYLWTYSIACQSCGYRFMLAKRPWISKKRGNNLAFVVKETAEGDKLAIETVPDDYVFSTRWIGKNGKAACPKCRQVHIGISIKTCRDELVACINNGERSGKTFSLPPQDAMPSATAIAEIESQILDRLGVILPSSIVPRWSGIVNPSLYGVETHSDFLNSRQRAVLLLLIACLRDEYDRLLNQQSPETAKAVICLLSGLVDQLVDWNCRLSMWISQNEQVGRAFSGPGVAMLWDYAETDAVLDGPANLWKKLDRIVAGTKPLEQLRGAVDVRKAYAQELPFESNSFDAIVTDPPYYDNIYYNVLADFFFSWKRLLLELVEPSLFQQETTDSTKELVASSIRSGDSKTAHTDYCREFAKAIREAERVLKPDGIFCLVYSHSSLGGWEAILQAYRPTNLRVTSVQPLSIERKARPRAMTSEAVNTCVALVSHPGNMPKAETSLEAFTSELRKLARELVDGLTAADWHEGDMGVAAFSQGVGMACNVSNVAECKDNSDLLRKIADVVREFIPAFKLVERRSL